MKSLTICVSHVGTCILLRWSLLDNHDQWLETFGDTSVRIGRSSVRKLIHALSCYTSNMTSSDAIIISIRLVFIFSNSGLHSLVVWQLGLTHICASLYVHG